MSKLWSRERAWVTPAFTFGDALMLTGLGRGTIQGWEARGLWRYPGPESGTGSWRRYSLNSILQFTLAGRLSRLGLAPRFAWRVLDIESERLLDAVYLVVTSDADGPLAFRTVSDFSELRHVLQPTGTVPTAAVVLNLAQVRRGLLEGVVKRFESLDLGGRRYKLWPELLETLRAELEAER